MSPTLPDLGNYTIVEPLIGQPGSGRVFLGRKKPEDPLVTLKVLDAESEDLRRIFMERAEFLRLCDHPSLLRTIESGTVAKTGAPWSAAVHVSAYSLADVLELLGPTVLEETLFRVAVGVSLALSHFEEKYGFHGDLRPRNVLVTPEGKILLADLGLPTSFHRILLPGAPDYAAPELLESRIDVDVRADLYALGVTLFLLATGKNPLADPKPGETKRVVPDPRTLNAATSERFARIVAGLTVPDRDARYDSPRQVGQDFVRVLRGEPPIGAGGKFARVSLDALVRTSKVLEETTGLVAIQARLDREKKAREAPAPTGGAPAAPLPRNLAASRFKITRGFSKQAAAEPSADGAPHAEPIEVDTEWLKRQAFQAGWIESESVDWNEVVSKREYFFRHAAGEATDGLPSLERPAEEEEALHAADVAARNNKSGRMVLSEDGMRAYQLVRKLGRGGQGIVHLVRVLGDQTYEGFANPVEEAAIKTAKHSESLERERSVYEHGHQGMVKLLDSGKIKGKHAYIVLERLYLHPFNLFSNAKKRMNVDVATAVDTFVNLLEILNGLHMRREMPIVLCDIKPDNIMTRMSNKGGTPTLQEYLRRISAGAYEPVFMDMGCAQQRDALRAKGGCLDELIGTPIYLPPESIPVIAKDFLPGIYSPKTDVYALTLSLYEYLTGERPYNATGIYRMTGREALFKVLEMKRKKVPPTDSEVLTNVLGSESRVFRKILDMGLHPDPDKRASAISLLEECKRTFKVKQNYVKIVGDYHYDEAKGLRLMQERYPRIDPAKNRYLDFRREAVGDAAADPDASADHMTVDEWFNSRDEDDPHSQSRTRPLE
jgi:serine/threonine-protein kinase